MDKWWYSDSPPFLTKGDSWKNFINVFNFLEPFYVPYDSKEIILGLIYHEFNTLRIKGRVKNIEQDKDVTTFTTDFIYLDIEAKFIDCGEYSTGTRAEDPSKRFFKMNCFMGYRSNNIQLASIELDIEDRPTYL